MDSSRPTNSLKLLTLQEAANVLAVSVEVLLRWNDSQILKPTITQTGHIGYTQDQIDQFLKIQQSLRTAKPSTESVEQAQVESFSRFSDFTDKPSTPSPIPHPQQGKSSPLRLFLSVTSVTAVLLIGILVQQGQKTNVLGVSTSTMELSLPLPNSQTAKSAFSGNRLNPLFANKQATTTPSTHTSQSPIATIAAAVKSQLVTKAQASGTPIKPETVNDITTNANTTLHDTKASNNSLFDKSGNITGENAAPDVLAMNISGAGMKSTTQPSSENAEARNQLILVVVAASGMVFFLIKKPRHSIPPVQIVSPLLTSQKFLEIDQRMDGTVVLRLQGKDYKISKPELHSDSDRFFERLMEVVGPGVKEIEYDNYNDDKMRLSTPLSRLVTRLGFVGIKRDLFFPRTSKHNVLFRKYITQEDLLSMNLKPDQVAKELVQSFVS